MLVLLGQRATEVEAEALRNYLLHTASLAGERVHKVILESCGMGDESFTKILDGLFA